MSPDIEQIPLSPLLVSNEVDDVGASQYLPLPTQNPDSPAQEMTDFADGSDALFSMYNEKAGRRDQKLAENWREDANAIMLLSGLISATVAGFLSQSYMSSQTNSQDVSAFYLSRLYQLQAASSNSSSTPLAPAPAPPKPTSTPTITHALWFASLAYSLATAVFATLIQEWVRRYQVMTQPLYSPHRSARIRAFITRRGSLALLQNTIENLHTMLHMSIFFFLLGLITLTSGGTPSILVVVMIYIALPVALYLRFSLTPYFQPHSLFSTPFSRVLFSCRKIPSVGRSIFRAITRRPGSADGTRHGTDAPTEVGWLTWVHTVNEIEKLSETCSSKLDTWTILTLIVSLSGDKAIEQFLAGLPGFYRSKRVENPAEILRGCNMDRLPKAIIAFMDHSLGLDSDAAGRQRITLSLKAIQADPYLLQRTFYHSLGFMESALFTCIDFVLLAEQYTNNNDPDVRFFARCIIAVAITRLGDYQTDERWAGIVQRGLDWSASIFAEYRAQPDSVRLRNLVQFARELDTTHSDFNDPSSQTILGYVLCAARQLQVENADLGIQREFCELWNSLVASILDQRQLPVVRSNAILSHLRPIYVTLHQGTDRKSLAFSATTDDLDPFLQKAHPLCTDPSHLTDLNLNANVYTA